MAAPPRRPPWRRAPSVGTGADGRFTDFYPEWTHKPHPSFTDGNYYAPAYRPALMPDDAQRDPTREALRFGIHPDAAPADPAVGRSMMTPIESHAGAAGRTADIEALEEEHQAMMLEDFTTSELLRIGAYAPDHGPGNPSFTPTGLQQDVLSQLLSRNKWQDTPRGKTNPGDVRLTYGLEPGVDFNARRDDRVWQAIRPALAVATRVLNIHPFWAAITNPYSLRPVPRSADSRTDAQFLADNSIPRVAIWPSQGLDGVGEMFPAARAMFDNGTTSIQLRAIIERFLGEILEFKFGGRNCDAPGKTGETNTIDAITQSSLDRDITKLPLVLITINVDIVWALLNPTFTAGEKAAWTLRLASNILHELACFVFCHYLYHPPEDRAAIFGARDCAGSYIAKVCAQVAGEKIHIQDWQQSVNRAPDVTDMIQPRARHLQDLGPQIGANRIVKGAVIKSKLMRDCWFYEDEQQAEEGKVFEKMIFGGSLQSIGRGGGPTGSRNKFLNPEPVAITSFPWAHRNPRTSEWNGEWSCGNYTLYLADPPPPFFSTATPLQAETASRFFRAEYWASDVAKFGHQGLKVAAAADNATLLPMTIAFQLSAQRAQYDAVFPQRNTYIQIARDIGVLETAGRRILARHLTSMLGAAIQRPMFEQYMAFWQASWLRTDGKIQDACALAERTFQAFSADAQTLAAADREKEVWQRTGTAARMTLAGAGALGAMRELLRLVAYELQVHQHFLFELSSNTSADRRALHPLYSGPVTQRLQGTFRDDILTRAAAACDALALTVAVGEGTPPDSEADYYSWSEGFRTEVDRSRALIGHLRGLLDEIVRVAALLRPADGDVTGAAGLEGDIWRALPKFQRRSRDKRRLRLATREADALLKGSVEAASVRNIMRLLPP